MKNYLSILILLLILCSAQSCKAQEPELNDTVHILCVGNSFTYFYDSYLQLQQLACREGQHVKVTATFKGGYTFGRHLQDSARLSVINRGPYDVVLLQDYSTAAAKYAQDPVANRHVLDDARAMVAKVRETSPEARIILERTWSYPGSNFGGFRDEQELDSLLEVGAHLLSDSLGLPLSPIGNAFTLARRSAESPNLFDPDNKHQSAYGSYLKSCVNYLIIFGVPFREEAEAAAPTAPEHPITADVTHNDWYSLDPATCVFLRSVALQTVMEQ